MGQPNCKPDGSDNNKDDDNNIESDSAASNTITNDTNTPEDLTKPKTAAAAIIDEHSKVDENNNRFDCLISELIKSQKIKGTRQEIYRILTVKSFNEKKARESTLAVHITKDLTGDIIIDTIKNKWDKSPIVMHRNETYINLDFGFNFAKQQFIDWMRYEYTGENWSFNIAELEETQPRLARRPVKLEIGWVEGSFTKESIEDTLRDTMAKEKKGKVMDIKEGAYKGNYRNITFLTDANGIMVIFDKNKGRIEHREYFTDNFMIIAPRIIVKPNICDNCLTQTRHNFESCKAIVCQKCTKPGHKANHCKEERVRCKYCQVYGHKTIDLACPRYLRKIQLCIESVDLPFHQLDSRQKRYMLINAMEYI